MEPALEEVELACCPPFVEHGESLRGVEIVVERRLERFPANGRRRISILVDRLLEAAPLRLSGRHRLVGEVDRAAPVRGEEEQEHRLATPPVEHLLDRLDVAERLRHLLARESEHPVVHPDLRELVTERPRLCELVLVMREDEVEPAAVDLEDGPEQLLGHRRALDVPARAAATPGRVPPGVLAPACSPSRARSRAHLPCAGSAPAPRPDRPLPGEAAVLLPARDAEVDVALDLVGVAALDQFDDERDDLVDRLGRPRPVVDLVEEEAAGVLDYQRVASSARAALAPGAAS